MKIQNNFFQEFKEKLARVLDEIKFKHNLAKVHRELKQEHHAFFEGKLAEKISSKKHAEMPAVKLISQRILAMLDSNTLESLYKIFNEDKKIAEELYSDKHFGRLGTEQEKPRRNISKHVYTEIKKILKNDQSNLDQVIHIHCIFIHRIFDRLITKFDGYKPDNKASLVNILFRNKYFSDRARVSVNENVACTQQYGFVKNPYFCSFFTSQLISRRRAVDVFELDTNSDYAVDIARNDLPFVAGPSGHTGSLLLGAGLYGKLNNEQLKEYLLATFAYLAAGGNHSFHEVMIIGRLVGLNYKDGEYLDVLPKSLTESSDFKALQTDHALYLMK